MKITLFCAIAAVGLCFQAAISAPLTPEAAGKIMSKSGCTTCHAVDRDKIGPAYNLVAKKYAAPDAVVLAYLKGEKPSEYLIKKVRSGTKLNVNKHWIKSAAGKPYGMMTPHSVKKISDENLKNLIDYILAIK